MPFGQRYFKKLNNSAPAPVWNQRGDYISYSLTIGQVYADLPMQQGVIWSLNLPQPYRPGITTKVIIRKGKIALSGVQTGYPTNIHLVIPGVQGFQGYQGYNSQSIATYSLSNVTLNQTTPPSYNLVYENNQDVITQIPLTQTQIDLKLFYDEFVQPQNLPLSFSFGLRLDLGWRYQRNSLNLFSSNEMESIEESDSMQFQSFR